MTASLEEIHRDPSILDRAIQEGQVLAILDGGRVAAELVPHDCSGAPPSERHSLPVHRGGQGLQPGVNLENREQMWDLIGGV